MLAVTWCKVKAVLLIAMLAVAEVRQVLESVRFQEQAKIVAEGMTAMRTDSNFQKQLIAEQMETMFADPSFQDQAKMLGKQMKAMMNNPNFQEQAKLLGRQLEAIKSDMNLQEQANMVAMQMKAMQANPNLQEHAQIITKQTERVKADPNFQKLARLIVEEMEAVLMNPNVQEHAKVVVKQMADLKVHLAHRDNFGQANDQKPAPNQANHHALAQNEIDRLTDRLVDKLIGTHSRRDDLVSRTMKISRFHHVDLDRTTLGKPSHLETPHRTSLRQLLPRRTASHWPQLRYRYFLDPRVQFNRASIQPRAVADTEDITQTPQLDVDIGEGLAQPDVSAADALSSQLDVTSGWNYFKRAFLPGQDIPLDGLDSTILGALDDFEAGKDVIKTTEAVETAVLDSVGHDLLIFLACASVATPIARIARVTPILTYLGFGALLGPNGLDVFTSSEADVELGDFGILFLLFAEGLEVSSERFTQLATFLPLGAAQISMTAGVISLAISVVPPFLERFLPLDAGLINLHNPGEILVLALAGTLSTSAFVFPVLKERGWEETDVGKAATSILLLQDLFVAPLLVLLPFIVGQGAGVDAATVAQLTAKATVGFSMVLVVGSYLLRQCFEIVVSTQSSDTFVAFSLLVAAGMGAVAKTFGLTDTVGAFAAGVLLANSNYKYEISASILPFRSILLGVFFLDAGCNFNLDLLLREAPTIAAGVALLLMLKSFTLSLAGFVDRFVPTKTELSAAENVRLSVLLAGGGEFAFVVLASAEKLGALPDELNSLLTTIVLITMSLTPLLGTAAVALSEPLAAGSSLHLTSTTEEENKDIVASDAIVICGYGEVGLTASEAIIAAVEKQSDITVEDAKVNGAQPSQQNGTGARGPASIVCFDLNPARLPRGVQENGVLVMYGDGSNAELVRATGVTAPQAIIVTYSEPGKCLSTTQRLHAAFPDAPIYARATSLEERKELIASGASATILETQELAVQLAACLFLDNGAFKLGESTQDDVRPVASKDLTMWEKAVRALRSVAKQNATPGTSTFESPTKTSEEEDILLE